MDKKESDRVTRERADLSKVDPKYIDDYFDRFKQRDEERARRNNPSSSASSWNKGKGSSSMETPTKHILLGCTGSVASVKVPEIAKALLKQAIDGRHMEIKIIATINSLNFINMDNMPTNVQVYTEEDEWELYLNHCEVLHIKLRRWADALIVAPLDANTMAKMANGICDNLLTCTIRAWDRAKPLFFCPAMNTHMWDHPLTVKHMRELKDLGYIEIPVVSKMLACGDIGYGGLADTGTIVTEVVDRLFGA